MIFDKPEHKQLVQEMIKQTNFPGAIAELIVELKQAVDNAGVHNYNSLGDVSIEKN